MAFFDLVITYVLPFILVLTVVVFVHEFGHYWVARRFGVQVETFSIGFGKEIVGYTDRRKTRWSLAWVPLGGYVKMFGDADPTSARSDPELQNLTADERKKTFFAQSVGRRFAIASAGPVANVVFTLVVFALLFMTYGMTYNPPVVARFSVDSPAERAGIRLGDRIVQIDDAPVDDFDDIVRLVRLNVGMPMRFDVVRAGTQVRESLSVTPTVRETKNTFGRTQKMAQIGVTSCATVPFADKKKTISHGDVSAESEQTETPPECRGGSVRRLPPLEALSASVQKTGQMATSLFTALGQMVVGARSSDELGGPLRIAEMSGVVAQQGAWALLWFMAVLSINLGLINLLPIPMLDGGHLFYCIAEKLRGKPLSERIHMWGGRVGATLLVGVMVMATWNDLVGLKVVSHVTQWFQS